MPGSGPISLASANERRDLLGRLLVARRKEVGVRRQDGLWLVAHPSRDNMQRHTVSQRVRDVSVAQDVQRPDREPRCLAELPEPVGQLARVDLCCLVVDGSRVGRGST